MAGGGMGAMGGMGGGMMGGMGMMGGGGGQLTPAVNVGAAQGQPGMPNSMMAYHNMVNQPMQQVGNPNMMGGMQGNSSLMQLIQFLRSNPQIAQMLLSGNSGGMGMPNG